MNAQTQQFQTQPNTKVRLKPIRAKNLKPFTRIYAWDGNIYPIHNVFINESIKIYVWNGWRYISVLLHPEDYVCVVVDE